MQPSTSLEQVAASEPRQATDTSEESEFRVVSRGELVPGVDRDTAAANLLQAYRLSQDAVDKLLSGRRPNIKSGLSLGQAECLVRRLERLGLRCRIEASSGQPGRMTDEQDDPAEPATAAEPFAPTEPFAVVDVDMLHKRRADDLITCPRCDHEQPTSRDTCDDCGVVFHKFHAAQEAERGGQSGNYGRRADDQAGLIRLPSAAVLKVSAFLGVPLLLLVLMLAAQFGYAPAFLSDPKLVLYEVALGSDFCADASALRGDLRAADKDPQVARLVDRFRADYGDRVPMRPFLESFDYRACYQEYLVVLGNLGRENASQITVRYNVPLMRGHFADRRPVDNVSAEIGDVSVEHPRAFDPRVQRLRGEGISIDNLAPGAQVTLRLFAWYRMEESRKGAGRVIREVVTEDGTVEAGDLHASPFARFLDRLL